MQSKSFIYDVALSFAGEDREYVRKVAEALVKLGVRVFFDEYEKASLWGKDLYSHLTDVYQNEARFVVLFISEHYARKVWTNRERQSAQARALREKREYILPARFDATEIEGLLGTTGYIDLRDLASEDLAMFIVKKLASTTEAEERTQESKFLATLAIKRLNQTSGEKEPFEFLINGKSRGSIKNGETLNLSLPQGQYALEIRCKYAKFVFQRGVEEYTASSNTLQVKLGATRKKLICGYFVPSKWSFFAGSTTPEVFLEEN